MLNIASLPPMPARDLHKLLLTHQHSLDHRNNGFCDLFSVGVGRCGILAYNYVGILRLAQMKIQLLQLAVRTCVKQGDVKYNSKYSRFKCNLKCLIFLWTIFYFDELYKHLDQACKKSGCDH